MKKINSCGAKPTVTAKKIKDLGVEVNPGYLSWYDNPSRILIRPRNKNGLKGYTSINIKEVQGDDQALFYAAAGLRNYYMRYGEMPSEEKRAQIVKRSLHTQKNKDRWFNRKFEKEPAKVWQKSEELDTDHSEISLDLDLDKFEHVVEQENVKKSKKRDLKYIYRRRYSVQVKVPKEKSTYFSISKHGGLDSTITQARTYRDQLLNPSPVNSTPTPMVAESKFKLGGFISKILNAFR
jgi:hypothetical protein